MQSDPYVHVKCPKCRAGYKIPRKAIPPHGRSGTCKKCGAKIFVRLNSEPPPQNPNARPQVRLCAKCNRRQDQGNVCYACGGPLKMDVLPAEGIDAVSLKIHEIPNTPDAQTGITVRSGFIPLMWLLFFTHPVIEVDGHPRASQWRKPHFIPLSPGMHRIKICFPYFFMSEAGGNEISIQLQHGDNADIRYNMNIPWIFAKGDL